MFSDIMACRISQWKTKQLRPRQDMSTRHIQYQMTWTRFISKHRQSINHVQVNMWEPVLDHNTLRLSNINASDVFVFALCESMNYWRCENVASAYTVNPGSGQMWVDVERTVWDFKKIWSIRLYLQFLKNLGEKNLNVSVFPLDLNELIKT